MMGQEFVYLITRDADLMKIMRVMADDAFTRWRPFALGVISFGRLRLLRLLLGQGSRRHPEGKAHGYSDAGNNPETIRG